MVDYDKSGVATDFKIQCVKEPEIIRKLLMPKSSGF